MSCPERRGFRPAVKRTKKRASAPEATAFVLGGLLMRGLLDRGGRTCGEHRKLRMGATRFFRRSRLTGVIMADVRMGRQIGRFLERIGRPASPAEPPAIRPPAPAQTRIFPDETRRIPCRPQLQRPRAEQHSCLGTCRVFRRAPGLRPADQ